jgi:hypothetical protein
MKKLSIVSALLFVLPCVALSGTLPDTGQIKCYDEDSEITCPSPGEPFYGQDGQHDTSPQSYTKLDENGDDLPDTATEWVMVKDNVTGLIWEVKTEDNKNFTYFWSAPQSFITVLNSSQFGGYSDWRLPSIKELMLIVNRGTYPKINTSYFPNTIPDWYWASPIHPQIPYYAWVVYFNDSGGVTYGHTSSDSGYVRAVRGEQSTNSFLDNMDGTVTDTYSGLMWQQATAPGTYTWEEALSYCENLTLAGYADWRLPDVNEIQSIVDYTRYNPAIDTTYFSNTMTTYYWSSTTRYGRDNESWAFWLNDGAMDAGYKSESYYVRAVRCGLIDDSDCDSIFNIEDNCPYEYNPNQEDTDEDEIGDVCDDCSNDPDNDIDSDGICGDIDNCPFTANALDLGTCIWGENVEAICTLGGYNPMQCGEGGFCSMEQEDSFPLDGNNCGDACECEGDFEPDGDVDGTDAIKFKLDFFRSGCTELNPCNGDFICDGDVDGTDALVFKTDFFRKDCPSCGGWPCGY